MRAVIKLMLTTDTMILHKDTASACGARILILQKRK